MLGEHQDAVVAEQHLRTVLGEVGGAATGFAIGQLVERQRERKRGARAAFPKAWRRLKRSGRQAWS